MNKLSQYLHETGETQDDFAVRVSVHPSIVSRLRRDQMRPSLRLAFDIERETAGRVPASSWVSSQREAS